jgi:hypothetical protein
LVYGDKVEFLQNEYKQKGKIPPALQNRPFIPFPLDGYFKAFLKLLRRRQAGYASSQALSPSDIILFGYAYSFEDDMEFFVNLVSQLDDHYLAWEADKAKQKRDQEKKAPVRKGRK